MALTMKARDRGLAPAAIEPHAVDDRLILFEAEQARFWIAGLRSGSDGADLYKPEPEPSHRFSHPAILIEAGGEPDRIGKVQPPQALRQDRRVGLSRSAIGHEPA